MNNKIMNIAGIGELLWDVQNGVETLGGAPSNFAIHCAYLGAASSVISCVGNDEPGKKGLQLLTKYNVNTAGIAVCENLPTGVVNATLSEEGIPDYDIKENVAWDAIPYNENLRIEMQKLDAICFGSLAQRSENSRASINTYLNDVSDACLKVFDINIRQFYYSKCIISESLEVANVLKISDEELPVLAELFNLQGENSQQMKQLIKRFNLRLAILTCRADGAYLFSEKEESYEKVNQTVNVKSTVGAGDAFTATAIVGYLNNKSLRDINKHANAVAAFVCSQDSAVPELPESLRNYGKK